MVAKSRWILGRGKKYKKCCFISTSVLLIDRHSKNKLMPTWGFLKFCSLGLSLREKKVARLSRPGFHKNGTSALAFFWLAISAFLQIKHRQE